MRKRSDNGEISVNAIAGTEVVLLGLNATDEARNGLLGFTILKRQGAEGAFKPLSGGSRTFPGAKIDGRTDSGNSPIQAFMWGDYVVDSGTSYTYRVIPLYGSPKNVEKGKSVDVTVTTESADDGTHGIFFNRGVAGSEAYSKRFGKYLRWYRDPGLTDREGNPKVTPFIKPEDVPNREAYVWLSRGLEEAMLAFIGQARGPKYSIRAAVYEFTHIPAIQAFVDALESGADVKIIHHAKRENVATLKPNASAATTTVYRIKRGDSEVADPGKTSKVYQNKEIVVGPERDAVCKAADHAVGQIGLKTNATRKEFKRSLDALDSMMIERTDTTISHNKFIVLLKNGEPQQVWTGSTNYTAGGIFGQSNVGHIIRDPKIAERYFEYWKKLSTDPKKKSVKGDPATEGIQNWTVKQQPDLEGAPPKNSITAIFSPRLTKRMLEWYAERLGAATNSVFFTSAFSVAEEILRIVEDVRMVDGHPADTSPYLRYLLLEGKGGLLKDKVPLIQKCPQNRLAWGEVMRARKGDDDINREHASIETLTGLNDHVNFLHTKYMLIDPLSDDPIVITGSANFSKASTQDNDENMVIIRGGTRVADIFLGEFMRLFRHFETRNRSNKLSDAAFRRERDLASNDSWTRPYYKEDAPERQERLLFS
jgi:phosphatidylserine/phosphatidylglycerophosphate/cardiolipin synthase-like enzyme